MIKLKKNEKKAANNVMAFNPEQCNCYYPCSCTSTPSNAYVLTQNQLTTRNYAGSYLIYN